LAISVLQRSGKKPPIMLFGNFGITFAKQIVRTPVVNSFLPNKIETGEQVKDPLTKL
jgi:hypothetical protein